MFTLLIDPNGNGDGGGRRDEVTVLWEATLLWLIIFLDAGAGLYDNGRKEKTKIKL